MLVGSTGGTSAAPLRFVCDGPRVQGEPAVGGALMVPTGLAADLAGDRGPFPGTSRPDRSSRNDLPAGGPPCQVRATGWMARSSRRRANISRRILTITAGERQGRHPPGPREVVDAELDDVEAQLLGPDHQLGVDERALADQGHRRPAPRRRQSLKAKLMSRIRMPNSTPHEQVVERGVDDADVALAGAVEAVGADDVGLVVAHDPAGLDQLVHVEGQVGVGVEDEVAAWPRRSRS